MKQLFTFLLLLITSLVLNAQETYPLNYAKDHRSQHYALTNATIFKTYNQKIENATLVIKDGEVVSVNSGKNVPNGAVEIDCSGKTIYPSFIDLYSDYGLPEPQKNKGSWSSPSQFVSDKNGAFGWNEAIRPETHANELFTHNSDDAKSLREIGFGTVLTHHQDGIARGSGLLVTLADEVENKTIINDLASAHYSFSKGSSSQNYPGSLMGAIALLRQTYYDAEWYTKGGKDEEYNISLKNWNKIQQVPQIFDAGNSHLNILRADKVGDEFGVQYIIKGNGKEYQRLDAIKATNASLIVPLNFPKAYDVEDPFDAHYVELKDMKHWEMAAHNLDFLSKNKINFALTTATLKSKGDFLKNLKKTIKKSGFTKENALKALTYTPATLINSYKKVGSLETGKLANFIVCSDDIFEKGKILENWVQGHQYIIKTENENDLTGVYDLKMEGDIKTYNLEVSGEVTKQKMEIVINDSTKIDVKHTIKDGNLSLSFQLKDQDGKIRLNGWKNNDTWKGKGQNVKGEWLNWTATKTDRPLTKKEEKTDKKDKNGKTEKPKNGNTDKKIGNITYPFMAYGWNEKPKNESVLIKNATIWTNEEDGIIENGSILLQNGKIAKIGKDLNARADRTIDAEGKHVTCGIIDEHSHISISKGVNEWTQSSSAEVRIGDVINSDDINMYRQLAGGVTTAQLLHGSANPIGGQSAIVKFRWGLEPEKLKFENADGFIKFALGENVKRSNAGDNKTLRFPQTRMGVEQTFVDHFTRAKEYEKAKQSGNYRTDLEMEAILEIVNSERFITCHSYVQSEINMLMKVAEDFDFRINTFTHILEGYKLADKMKEHGANGSTFSDWWTYKFEVNDAIPHNAAIMTEMGVNTAINSDDADMARRLNTEAAKGVKYGGMSEEVAWKMVTLNPAKMLHLDDKVGSLKVGKDADVVVWSGHPLSVYSKAEQTFVDGVCYFDIENDEKLRQQVSEERNRLIQLMLEAKKAGEPTQKPQPTPKHHYHCDDMEDEGF